VQKPLKNKYGIIILAAGNSSRMGKPKQLLRYQNKTLIRHILDESVEAIGKNIVVVLGADANLIKPELSGKRIIVVDNKKWKEGMASSIRAGVSAIMTLAHTLDGVILAVCDQPFVSSDLFKELIALKENTDREIIACTYDNTFGTPALFSRKYFTALMDLDGTEGAKKLLMQHNEDLVTIPFPMGSTDIDTMEDYNRLNSIK
jgi:molybdenum cofactor cytidylyltransferase